MERTSASFLISNETKLKVKRALKNEHKWMSMYQIKVLKNSVLVSCFWVPSILRMKGFKVLSKSHDLSSKLDCHSYG